MLSVTVVALLSFAAAAFARPNGAPTCAVDGAADALTAAMGANVGRIPCTFSADKTSYTPGSTITVSWTCTDIDNYQGLLAYASPANDPTKRVGEFTLLDGLRSNKAACGDAAEKDNSVITQSAPGQFPPTGSITYTASETDYGNLEFSFIVVKKVDTGFRWGIFPKAVTVTAPGSSAEGANYGTVSAGDEYSCNCPAPSTVSVIRKCTPKTTATTKVHVTKTKTNTKTVTTTTTEKSTTTVTETISGTCGDVAGGEETPTSSMMEHETTTMMEHETTTAAYGEYDDYDGDVDDEETTTAAYGQYEDYNGDEDDEDDYGY